MGKIELKDRQDIPGNTKLSKAYGQFGALLDQLKSKELPLHIRETVDQDIAALNAIADSDNALLKCVKQKQTAILKLL